MAPGRSTRRAAHWAAGTASRWGGSTAPWPPPISRSGGGNREGGGRDPHFVLERTLPASAVSTPTTDEARHRFGAGRPAGRFPLCVRAQVVRVTSAPPQGDSSKGAPRPVPSRSCRPLTAYRPLQKDESPDGEHQVPAQADPRPTTKATERNKAVKSRSRPRSVASARRLPRATVKGHRGPSRLHPRSRQGREQGCHPPEPGRQQEVGHGQEGRVA